MGAVTTGIVHGVIGAGTHVATELVNGRTPTVAGTLATGVTSGILAGGMKAVGSALSKLSTPQNLGSPFKGIGSSQRGIYLCLVCMICMTFILFWLIFVFHHAMK